MIPNTMRREPHCMEIILMLMLGLTSPHPRFARQISMVMDKFETQFEDMDVQTSYMEGTMGSSVASSTPQDQIDLLMAKVADENGIELNQKMGDLAAPAKELETAAPAQKENPAEEDQLAQRLRALRPAV